jgi:micrococcal nuclease
VRRLISLLLVIGVGVVGWLAVGKVWVEVDRVIDGDTIKLVDGRVVRYIGIDAPEADQCFAEQAREMNQQLVEGKKVRLVLGKNRMDRFGRSLAYVFVRDNEGEKVMVNQELLRLGAGEFFWDTVNLGYQGLLVEAAEFGHGEGLGKWAECGEVGVGCVIKGNLDKLDKRWYHLPEFRHYDQAVVNLSKGDRWFCNEGEAIEAGFEQARE